MSQDLNDTEPQYSGLHGMGTKLQGVLDLRRRQQQQQQQVPSLPLLLPYH